MRFIVFFITLILIFIIFFFLIDKEPISTGEKTTQEENIIDQEIYSLRINQIVTECLDSCINQVIEENKFGFYLPFD